MQAKTAASCARKDADFWDSLVENYRHVPPRRLSMTPRLQPGGPRHWAWVVWTVIIGKAYVDQSHQMGGL